MNAWIYLSNIIRLIHKRLGVAHMDKIIDAELSMPAKKHSLYHDDREAYHKHVHDLLMRLGFTYRYCLQGETHCGYKIKLHYWKKPEEFK